MTAELTPASETHPPPLRPHVGSWAIIDRETGRIVTELWRDDPRIHALNLSRYRAVPIDEWLASLSKRGV